MSEVSRRRLLSRGTAGLAAAVVATRAAPAAAESPPVAPKGPVGPGPGAVALDSFAGGSDDDRLDAAFAHARAQTYKPTIVLANRAHDFARTHPIDFAGLRLAGPPGGMEREFHNTNQVNCPPGGLFATVRDVTKDVAITGLCFTGTGQFLRSTPVDASGPILTDARISDCGFFGFTTVITGTVLRVSIQSIYVNAVTGSAFVLGGSDCWLFTEGENFMSGQLPPGLPYVDLVHLSQSRVGRLYVTPQGGYALRVQDTFGGLTIVGFMSDGTGRTGATSTARHGLLITGGQGIVLRDFWCFNVNTSGESRGEIVVTGGSDVLFDAPVFARSHGDFTAVNTDSPCIYTTVPIQVANPRALTGHPRVLHQARWGLISLTGAPGWRVRTGSWPGWRRR